MKKFVFFLLIVLFAGPMCFAQQGLQSARKYLSVNGGKKIFYPTSSMEKFAMADDIESIRFRELMLSKTGEGDINDVFANSYVTDTTLPANSYVNSGWDPVSEEFVPFPGKYYKGKVTVYQKNGVKILLYKNECGNVLNFSKDNNYSRLKTENILKNKFEIKQPSPKGTELENSVQPENENWSFRQAKNFPKETISLNLPTTEEAISSKRKLSVFGKIAIGVGSAIVAGTIAYLVWKNQQKKPTTTTTTGHGVDPNPGGGGIDPPPTHPSTFGFGLVWSW